MCPLRVLGDDLSGQFEEHIQAWYDCTRCKIGEYAQKKVLARGTLPCDLLFIGEGPGKDEDRLGLPFVGRSGELLDKWIKRTVDMWEPCVLRVAITNTVACRPTDRRGGPNRKPTDSEQSNCAPRFKQLLTMANPRGIILLGKVAEEYWLSQPTEFVNQWPYLELYHPAYCLRQGGAESRASKETQERLVAFLEKHFL